MGLTVHFELFAARGCTGTQARRMVAQMRDAALLLQKEGLVDEVLPVTADVKLLQQFACDWVIVPLPGGVNTFTGAEVLPVEGQLFCVKAGKDCEPLWLGLCRYPVRVRFGGKELRTKKGAVWRLAGACKTQFASLHGWEHFQRCHCAVVNLLAACRRPGLRVVIRDEGGYWPGRSLRRLRKNLDEMNRLVAAMAGTVKDGGAEVKSPIFQHQYFERLEAEGEAKHGAAIRRAGKAVSRLKNDQK